MAGIDTIGRLNRIHDQLRHTSSLFPADTNLTWTMTALNTANTFSNWAEIQDSAATKLSASFATADGHISAVLIETISELDAIYEYEIAWGAAKSIICRGRFAGGTKFVAPKTYDRIWAPHFPAGELLYYRMKTASAVADTCTAHIRHHSD